jgi:hypothetical protein
MAKVHKRSAVAPVTIMCFTCEIVKLKIFFFSLISKYITATAISEPLRLSQGVDRHSIYALLRNILIDVSAILLKFN